MLVMSPAFLRAEGGVFAGLELASTSIKGLTFSFQTVDSAGPQGVEKNVRLKRIQAEEENRPFISYRDGCRLSPKGLDELVTYTKVVLKKLQDGAAAQKLGALQLYAVGSSGLGSVCNREEIIERIQAATGLCMEFITASDEARYSLGFVLPRDRYRSVIADVGGGNTKIGYYVTLKGSKGDPQWHGMEVPYGSRTLKDEATALAKSSGTDYYTAVGTVIEQKVRPIIQQLKSEHSYLTGAPQIYMLGGAVWASSAWAKPTQTVEWAITSLRTTDFDEVLKSIRDDEQRTLKDTTLPKGTTVATKSSAVDVWEDVKKRLDPEMRYAGARLAQVLANEIGGRNPLIYFPVTATWISGYARQKFYDTRKGAPVCSASSKVAQ